MQLCNKKLASFSSRSRKNGNKILMIFLSTLTFPFYPTKTITQTNAVCFPQSILVPAQHTCCGDKIGFVCANLCGSSSTMGGLGTCPNPKSWKKLSKKKWPKISLVYL